MENSLAAEPLLALAVTVTSEQRVDSVLQSIVQWLGITAGGSIGSDLAAAIRRPPQRLPHWVGSLR